RAILSGDADLFIALADEIADILDGEGVEYVAGDAVEGANPVHDLCRLLLNAALLRIEQTSGRRLKSFEFALEGPPGECPLQHRADAILLKLDDEAYGRKVATAQSFPGMTAVVGRLLGSFGPEAFRTECLRPVRYGLSIADRFPHPPAYESYG